MISIVSEYSQEIADAKNLFNIDYKFEITQQMCGYYEIFGFATALGNSGIIDFYFNNQNILANFGFYFKDKAEKMLNLAKERRHRLIDTDYSAKFGVLQLKANTPVLTDF